MNRYYNELILKSSFWATFLFLLLYLWFRLNNSETSSFNKHKLFMRGTHPEIQLNQTIAERL